MNTESRMRRKADAKNTDQAESMLAKDRTASIPGPSGVRMKPKHNPPTSIRLSAPLLERLDRLAAAQHRTRGNLIQHILWEHLHALDERPRQ
jgi:hypothetical protein